MSIPPCFLVLVFLFGKFSLTSIIFVNNELMMDMTIMLFTYLTRVIADNLEELRLSINLIPVLQVRIQRGGQGVQTPLENHKLYGFL